VFPSSEGSRTPTKESAASSQMIFQLKALMMISCTFMTRCCSSGVVSIVLDTYPFYPKRSFHLFSHRSLHFLLHTAVI
jgi:hypothetical protein